MNLNRNPLMDELVPSEFYLSQNYPNPFSEKTIIKYCVAYKTKVKIEVFSSEDKIIERLLDEEKEAGTYEIEFSSRHSGSAKSFRPCLSGRQVVRNLQSGNYYYRLVAGDYKSEKKMILIK
jgi:hypothetical protein